PGGGHSVKVATMKSLIAHETFNERNRLTVRRPAWHRHLERGFVDGCGAALGDTDRVDLRDPPVVVAGPWSGGCYKRFVVGRPIEIVNVKIRWRNLAQLGGAKVKNSNPLVMDRRVDDTGHRWRGQ